MQAEREKFNRVEMIDELSNFHSLYSRRIIKDQICGMRSPHLFPSWYIIKKISPKFIVESGVWKGLGTWFFEEACPYSEIFSIDPDPSPREYTSTKSTYSTVDFTEQDWSHLDPDQTLLFFDDHQNPIERIKFARGKGFKKFIFEDNYPPNQGDCYSLKKIFSQREWVIDSGGVKTWFSPVREDYNFLVDNTLVYQEMPPIYKNGFTRWGDAWEESEYPTPDPLLSEEESDLYPDFYLESKNYTWICYLEIR